MPSLYAWHLANLTHLRTLALAGLSDPKAASPDTCMACSFTSFKSLLKYFLVGGVLRLPSTVSLSFFYSELFTQRYHFLIYCIYMSLFSLPPLDHNGLGGYFVHCNVLRYSIDIPVNGIKSSPFPFRSSRSSGEDRNTKMHSQGNVEGAMTESRGREKETQLWHQPGGDPRELPGRGDSQLQNYGRLAWKGAF